MALLCLWIKQCSFNVLVFVLHSSFSDPSLGYNVCPITSTFVDASETRAVIVVKSKLCLGHYELELDLSCLNCFSAPKGRFTRETFCDHLWLCLFRTTRCLGHASDSILNLLIYLCELLCAGCPNSVSRAFCGHGCSYRNLDPRHHARCNDSPFEMDLTFLCLKI